jgi:hypothetical protein
VVAGIRDRAPGLAVAVRLSLFDVVPHVPGEGGVGVPEAGGPYPHAFGGDGTGLGIDLRETHALLDLLAALGIALVGTTAGSPYYCPHVQRPATFPPSDGYQPPEDPLIGVARQLAATAEVAARHPELTVVGAAGSRRLPAAYVRQSVELAYATTAFGAQGETASTCHVLVVSTPAPPRRTWA